jgi:para-nitrobenzyl esterase
MPRPAWMDLFGLSDPPDDTQSEDCLVLNVWTPGVSDGAHRPVLFRIHGGGYGAGSGSWNWHDGTNLARRGDVVVVTVNHRLAPLGYLYLDEIGGPDYQGSGNAGMLDLVLALQWVRDNIEAFGGDPRQVMIFGESGGGAKVSLLLAMPEADGLFHRAVIQSGPGLKANTAEEATEVAEQYLAELGVAPGQLDKLAGLPTQRFLDANMAMAAKTKNPRSAMMLISPVVDGRTLLVQPGEALAGGASGSIPVIVGCTSHEMSMFMAQEPDGFPEIDETEMRLRLTPVLGDRLEPAIEVFRASNPNVTTTELFLLIHSAAAMRSGSIRLAERKMVGGSAPVYMYMLTWRSPIDRRLGAPHGMCVPLSMDNCHTAQWSDYPKGRELGARMSQAWINFAAGGNPNHGDLPRWNAYSAEERATMHFDDPCSTVNDPCPQERLVLQDVPGLLG